MKKDEEFLVVTDVQSVERMLTNAEIDYEVEVSSGEGIIMLIEANGINFHFTPDGELDYMGQGFPEQKGERSMKGVC